MTINTLKPASYRVRLISNRWYVRIYADMTLGDCIAMDGPFPSYEAAGAHGASLGIPDGDK